MLEAHIQATKRELLALHRSTTGAQTDLSAPLDTDPKA